MSGCTSPLVRHLTLIVVATHNLGRWPTEGAAALHVSRHLAAFVDLIFPALQIELPPLFVSALAKVDFDASVVDDDVVHLFVCGLCRLLRLEFNEGIVERVARFVVWRKKKKSQKLVYTGFT
jgi:hypothetical protein